MVTGVNLSILLQIIFRLFSKTNDRSAVESQETEIHFCEKTQVIFILQYRLGVGIQYNFDDIMIPGLRLYTILKRDFSSFDKMFLHL